MTLLRWLLPLSVALSGIMLTPARSHAQPDYSKKERLQCVVCHDGSWQSSKYTDAGKYYLQHHSFKGYRPVKPPIQK